MTNLQDTQREQCAGVDFVSHTCVVCGVEFNPRQYNQVTCGATGCRFGRHRRAIRAQEHKQHVQRTWDRRRAKSLVVFISETRGPKSRDSYKEAHTLVRDKGAVYSRCLQCGTDFVDGEGRP
jgi:hypothetical protein